MKEADIRPQALFDEYLRLARKDVRALLKSRRRFVRVPCPACGEKKSRVGLVKEGFRYVICASCESLYANPRPTPELLGRFYRDGESVRFWSTDFFKKTAEARRERMFKPRAELISRLADGSRGGTFVDVGSGYAIFLEEVRKLAKFKRVVGIEPNPDMARIGRSLGFDVIEKIVEDVRPEECRADFATAFEVLEHVFSPLEFLAASRPLLAPGGRLLFTTLTVSGFDIQVLWERSNSVHPPHHLNLLSVEGMRRLVARAGLSIVELTTPGQLDVDIVVNAAKADPRLPLSRFARALITADEGTRRDFQSFLARNNLSSHIRVVCSALEGGRS